MASIKLTGDTSGEITISAPAVAGTNTLTLPANTGTIVTSASGAGDLPSTIAGPAFRAYLSATQSIPHATFTKLQLDTEVFDTNSNYDNATNYRFTPTIAGYYFVAMTTYIANLAANEIAIAAIYKNGSEIHRGTQVVNALLAGNQSAASTLLYMNGSTDYIEFYVYHSHGSSRNANGIERHNNATAFLARAA